MIKIYHSFLFIFCLISLGLNAQIQTDSIVVVQQKKYTIHKVQAGETLASLGRLYNVPFAQMKEANPEFVEKLDIGDFVKVPHLDQNNGSEKPIESNSESTTKYLTHKVEEKETLYAITRKYKITTDSIFLLNPGLQEKGLKAGTEINVGVNPKSAKKEKEKEKQASKELIQPKIDENQTQHTVAKKETIFSITQKYSISEKDFLAWNPAVVQNGLKVGEKVIVGLKNKTIDKPKPQPQQENVKEVVETPIPIYRNNSGIETSYIEVLVFLPLKLKTVTWDTEKKKINEDTQLSLEFYNGFLLALDTLKDLGLKVKLKVIDTSNDTAYVKSLISNKSIGKPDVIIGPIYTPEFKILAKYAKEKNILIINPLGKNDEVIKNLPTSVRMRPDNDRKYYATADYLAKNYSGQNVVIAYETGDAKLAEKMKSYLSGKNSSIKIHLAEGIFQPLNNLIDGSKNAVWVLNDEESYPSRLVNKLYSKKSLNIEVFGTEEWVDFKNIDIIHWEELNIHIAGSLNYMYYQREFPEILSKYFNKCGVDMSFYAMIGFDAAWVNFKPLIGAKNYTTSGLENKKLTGMLMDYYFAKADGSGGLKNTASSVYKYNNYKFTKVH
jgi:LysM repeat protein